MRIQKQNLSLGCVSVVLIIILLGVLFRFFELGYVGDEVIENQVLKENMRSIGYALAEYSKSENGDFPKDICDEDGKPILSWRVLLYGILEPKNSNIRSSDPPSYNFDETSSEQFSEICSLYSQYRTPEVYLRPTFIRPRRKDVEGKTSTVAIRESIEKLNAKISTENDIILIIVSPEDAVTWYDPIDVSRDDLISGKISPYVYHSLFEGKNGTEYMLVLTAEYSVDWIPIPKNKDEWLSIL